MKPNTSLNMLMSLTLNQKMNLCVLPILWSICTAKFLRHFVVFFDFLKISSFQNEKLATQADQKWTSRWAWNEMLAQISPNEILAIQMWKFTRINNLFMEMCNNVEWCIPLEQIFFYVLQKKLPNICHFEVRDNLVSFTTWLTIKRTTITIG